MKRIFLTLVMVAAMITTPLSLDAKTEAEQSLIRAMNADLPVYIGNNLSWTGFDIADNGDYVMIYTSTELPAAADITPEMKFEFSNNLRNALGGEAGMAETCRKIGRPLQFKLMNAAKEMCIEVNFSLPEQRK